MARMDRLMRLMTALRSLPAPVTAQRLAEETDVSPRQLYRDIATLRAGGALIDGAPGVGYTLTEDPALPPHSFDRLEIEALMLALAGLEQMGDPTLARAGRGAMSRILATLPDTQARQALHHTMMTWRPPPDRPEIVVDMDLLRHHCWEERSLLIQYRDVQGRVTEREVWPLAISYSDRTLMLMALCRLRRDFRSFNIAQMEWARDGGTQFRPHRVALLRDFIARYRA